MDKKPFKFYVIGDPIDHSLSPIMQNYFLQQLNIAGEYKALHVKSDEIEQAIQFFKDEGVDGFNITAPHKETIYKIADELTIEAQTIGSVNTVRFQDGKIIGHNTDGIGFTTSLQIHDFEITDKKIVLFGAGGAARAVILSLIQGNCNELILLNRNIAKANKLISEITESYPDADIKADSLKNNNIEKYLKTCHLLINSTSVGMGNLTDQSVLPDQRFLNKDILIYDLIYRPYKTKLIHQAEAAQLKWINGLAMLIFQGFESLKFWTNKNVILNDSFYNNVEQLLRRKVCQE